MKKRWLIASLFSFISLGASAQTLFTYGPHKADAKEFLRAFNKNNQQPAAAKSRAIQEYLDLYINSRLKIREAYDRSYDTLPQIKAEVDNLRNQIVENYMSDPAAISRLTKEAFQRSQKDIHAAHIFISSKNGSPDSAAARKKLNDILKRLSKGEDFLTVAQQLSEDPSAKTNKGDLNFITVFTLPYEFENIIYTTPAGKYSATYSSKAGYHIFKNLGERKALGKIKVQQILLAFPPGSDEATIKKTGRLADSLYQAIGKGADFGKLVATYSIDNVSAAANGNIPDISVGQFDPAFEKILVTLPNGSVSKPLLTSHGYHIIKKIAVTPIASNVNDKANTEALEQKVMGDDRWKTAKDFIYTRVKSKPGLKKANYKDATLWALSDSLLYFKPIGIGSSMSRESILLTIGDTSLKVEDWIVFAQMNGYKADRSGMKTYPELMDEFSSNALYQYYRNHLEEYNEDFRNQMAEFRDGNLFFEIMQQEVWNKAQSDSAALLTLYEKNKSQYNWKESADAILFFCSDEATGKALYEQLKKDPANWRKVVEPVSEKVVADSARYEWTQLPGIGKAIPKAGTATPLTVNPTDNTSSFAYIINIHTQASPRTFAEAKGLVMNDYQTWLEEEWLKSLRKKYPVKVEQAVLNNISK